MRFGAFLTPTAANADQVIALAQLSEQVGLDLVTMQDHPYQSAYLDTFTLLTAVAAHTESITLAPNVANLPLRPPAVLARQSASIDLLSGGRFELGLGAGSFWDAVEAMGGRRLSPGQSVDALAEAITIIRALWHVDERRVVRVDGEFYRVAGAKRGPRPAHPIGIWIGAYGRRMLQLTGRTADGWLPSLGYLDPTELAEKNAVIDDAAVASDRAPADVRRLLNVSGTFERGGSGAITGPPAEWVDRLAGFALNDGVSTFILGSDDPNDLRRFAADVAPAVREIVATERDGSRPLRPEPREQLVASSTHVAPVPDAVLMIDALGVTPTPDDGVRRSSETPWDESARPSAPLPDPARTYTAHERATSQHLIDIHDGLRAELAQLYDLVAQVGAGTLGAGDARSAINQMTMRQNNWTLGTYCESYCRIVTMHHSIEDAAVFPHLRRGDERLGPVLDRLQQEHLVIHDVLDRVDRALVALVTGTGDIDGLRATVDVLSDTLLSHLSYEERQLVEPLARLGMTGL